MSQDESLRLAATVVDGFTGPLKNLRTQMQGLAKEGAGHNETLEKGFGKLAGAMRSAEQAAAAGLNPALKTVGVTSLTTTAAILGIGAAMRSFATGAASLGQMSRDTGIAAQTLRDFGAVAGKFNVTQEQVAQGAQTFSDKMRVFSKGQGELWSWINRQGTTGEGRKHFQDFAADLARTSDMGEKLKKGLQELENIKDPRERRIFAEQFFGNADIGRLGEGHLGKLKDIWDKTAGKLGPLDPKAVESAERFNRSMADLGSSMSKLGTTIGTEVLPYAERFTTWIDGIVSDQRGGAIQAIREGLGGIKAELDGINWKQAGEDSLAFLRESTALAGTLARSLRTVAEVMRAWRAGSWSDVFRATTGGQGTLGKAVRMIDPKAGDDAIQQRAEVEALKRELKAAEYDQETGGPALDFKSREPVLKKRLADAEAELKRMEARSPEQRQKEFEASEKLRQSIDKLGEKVDAARGANGSTGSASQDALLQLQSYGGGTGIGALVQKASLGGRTYGGGGAGTLGERLFGQPTGSAALGDPYRERRMQALLGDPSAEWRMRILRGERGVPLPGSGGASDRGFTGSPFGAPKIQLPGPDTPAGKIGRELRGETGGNSGPARTSEMMGYAMDQLRKEGVPEANLREAAAHLVGQATMESGLDPNKVHDGGTGYGIYGARDPKGWGSYNGARRSDMVRWLEANGYARNSAEGQMREMAHRAMSGRYSRTRAILMGQGSGDLERDTNTITGEFESPAVINRRSGAVRNALRVGPSEPALARSAQPGGEGDFFPNGAPRVLKPKSMADDPSVPGIVMDRGRLVRPEVANGPAFAAAYRAREAAEADRRKGFELSPKVQEMIRSQVNGGSVTADGRVNISVLTRDPNPQVRSSASGNLFREIVQSKGRQMAPSGD